MKILLNPNYAESEEMRISFFRETINRDLRAKKDCRILDVGSSQLGFGGSLESASLYSIDYVQPTQAIEGFKLCNLNQDAIPFESDFFDAIVAGEVIEHIERPFEFIKECSRTLKKDGMLLLSTPTPHYYLEILKDIFGISTLDDSEHLNLFSKSHLTAYAQAHGFKLVDYKRYKFWIPFIKLMVLSINNLPIVNYQQLFIFRKV